MLAVLEAFAVIAIIAGLLGFSGIAGAASSIAQFLFIAGLIIGAILLVLGFVANAFLKFVWSHRLFGYCAIMMAAVPNRADDPHALPRALQAAEINITAAKSFNSGLRCVYFSLAALGWLAGPLWLLIATMGVLAISIRREFASGSRRVILERLP